MLYQFTTSEEYQDHVSAIVYHHESDPWYTIYPSEHNGRHSYYSMFYIPAIICDGLEQASASQSGLRNAADERLDVESPVAIDLLAYPTESEDALNIDVVVTSGDEAVGGNYKLRVAAVTVFYDGYTSSEGQNVWRWDLLDFAGTYSGYQFSIDANSTEEYNLSIPWPISLQGTPIEDNNFKIVAFIQNDNTREVIQSEITGMCHEYDVVSSSDESARIDEPGTEFTYEFSILNRGLCEDTYNITFTVECPFEWTYEYTTPDGPQSGNSTITLDSFEEYTGTVTITTDEETIGCDGLFYFVITSQSDPEVESQFDIYAMTSGRVLVINADPDCNHKSLYEDALMAADDFDPDDPLNYSLWNYSLDNLNTGDLDELPIELIVYYTGGECDEIDDDQISSLEDYLLAGGNLLITGSGAAEALEDADLLAYMGATYQGRYEHGVNVYGVDNDPFSDGMDIDLGGGDGADNLGEPSSLRTDGSGEVSLFYSAIRRAAVRNETETYRSLILGFPFEAIASNVDRNTVMLRALNFLIEYGLDATPEDQLVTLPSEYSLQQNYPNPFNPSTEIRFAVPQNSQVRIDVYNMLGQYIQQLVNGSYTQGSHSVVFDASGLPSGIYFYRMTTPNYNEQRKMLLVK